MTRKYHSHRTQPFQPQEKGLISFNDCIKLYFMQNKTKQMMIEAAKKEALQYNYRIDAVNSQLWLSSQPFLDGVCLTLLVCGRAHRGSTTGFHLPWIGNQALIFAQLNWWQNNLYDFYIDPLMPLEIPSQSERIFKWELYRD